MSHCCLCLAGPVSSGSIVSTEKELSINQVPVILTNSSTGPDKERHLCSLLAEEKRGEARRWNFTVKKMSDCEEQTKVDSE